MRPIFSLLLTEQPASTIKQNRSAGRFDLQVGLLHLEVRLGVRILLVCDFDASSGDLVERLVPVFSVPTYSYFLRKVSV